MFNHAHSPCPHNSAIIVSLYVILEEKMKIIFQVSKCRTFVVTTKHETLSI